VDSRTEALGTSALSMLGMGDIVATTDADGNHSVTVNGGANDSSNSSIPKGMALIGASDSKIVLNGATLTSSSTMVSVNGLDITLTEETGDKEISFSVSNDVDAVYNSIKDFVNEYNSIMKEMKTLYDAPSSKGYEPLSADEKKAMSDSEVELWENKIKDSLLRRDSNLGGIMSGMRTALLSTSTVGGKTYALSSFGIMTSSDYNEGGMLHIFGDTDDAVYSGNDDKLKKALTEDPENTIKALSDIFSNLRKDMSNRMAASNNSSSLTFYDDLKMKKDAKSYESEIKSWEDKLAEIEDNYYKKFTAMETAMAKLQAQQSSLAGLFGTG
jgi:flagellar hook-associated protein 2